MLLACETNFLHTSFATRCQTRSCQGSEKSSGQATVGWLLPSGKLTVCYGKSPFSMGKSTINGPFSMAMLNYQRVDFVACFAGSVLLIEIC